MEVIRFLVLLACAIIFAYLIHAPINLGIQSFHLSKEGKVYRAALAIVAGWIIVGTLLILGYIAGAGRIFG